MKHYTFVIKLFNFTLFIHIFFLNIFYIFQKDRKLRNGNYGKKSKK